MSKIIVNKETRLLLPEDVKTNYVHLLNVVMNQPITEGITINEMRRDVNISTKLDGVAVDATVEFTDEEFAHLVKLVEAFKWGMTHVDLLEFGEYMISLK